MDKQFKRNVKTQIPNQDSKKERIAIVVQRCHPQALGGSEALAWQYACLLKDYYEVDVLSSRAVSALHWKEEIPVGWRDEKGIRVCHFSNWEGHGPYWQSLHGLLLDAYRRHMQLPVLRSTERPKHCLDFPESLAREWLRFQGPHSPELLDYLKKNNAIYKKIIFVTYLYSPTVFGLPLVPSTKSLLVPTLHDEPPAWLSIFSDMAKHAGTILWNTKSERKFGELLWGKLPGRVVAMGIDLAFLETSAKQKSPAKEEFLRNTKNKKYLLYLGRIDAGKGCDELITLVKNYNKTAAQKIHLLLAGVLQMKLPKQPWLQYLGFLSEVKKALYLKGALALVMPSRNESLSLVTLEAMALKTPVIVQAQNEVLMEHVSGSRCGRAYTKQEDFFACLREVQEGIVDSELSRGRVYVEKNYSLKSIQQKLIQIIEGHTCPTSLWERPEDT